MRQGLGPKKHDEISEIGRTTTAVRRLTDNDLFAMAELLRGPPPLVIL